MKYICAWCGAVLDGYPESDSEEISHGICEKCADEEYRKAGLEPLNDKKYDMSE